MGHPASFSFIFVFSNIYYNFYNKYMWNNVHPEYGAGIQTHDLQDMSLPHNHKTRGKSYKTLYDRKLRL